MTGNKRPLETVTSISKITPYLPSLIVKARITSKTSLKDWYKDQKKTQLFSCQLLDSSGEIRMTFFGEQCTHFYDQIQVGKIYDIKNATVKKSLKKYNDINHKFELNATKSTTIDIDETTSPKSMKLDFNFQNLKSLLDSTEENCTDIVGIIKDVGEISECYSSSKDQTYKRKDIDLVDDTNTMITLNLWGDHAINFSGKIGDVIVLKRAKLNIYQEIVKLSTTSSTLIIYDYEGEEKKMLEKHWSSLKKKL